PTRWPGQKLPVALVAVAGPVTSGERLTLITPTCVPSMQPSDPDTPAMHGCVASAPPVMQSRVRPAEFVLVQARPARGPRSQVPWPGLLGVPLAEHFGQGCPTLPVRYVSEASPTVVLDVPLERSSVPPAGALKLFSTQVLRLGREGFGIGSGVPKLHPTSLQSGSQLVTGGAVLVAPIVQLEPEQLSEKRLIDPSGVGPSCTVEAPPPRLRPPHVRVLTTAFEASLASPHVPPGNPLVKSRVV